MRHSCRTTSPEFLYIDQRVHQKGRRYRIESDVSNVLQGVERTHRAESIITAKWWSLSELGSTKESDSPEQLPEKLKKVK